MYKTNTQEKRRLLIGIALVLRTPSRILFDEADDLRSLYTAARVGSSPPSWNRWRRHHFQLATFHQPDDRVPLEPDHLSYLIDRVPLLGYHKIDKHPSPRPLPIVGRIDRSP